MEKTQCLRQSYKLFASSYKISNFTIRNNELAKFVLLMLAYFDMHLNILTCLADGTTAPRDIEWLFHHPSSNTGNKHNFLKFGFLMFQHSKRSVCVLCPIVMKLLSGQVTFNWCGCKARANSLLLYASSVLSSSVVHWDRKIDYILHLFSVFFFIQ